MYKLKWFLLLCVIAVTTATYGQGKPYPMGSSTTVLNTFRQQLATSRQQDGISRLPLKVTPSITLTAAITHRMSAGNSQEQLIGSIDNVPNSSFYLLINNQSVDGHILLGNSKTAYQYYTDNSGQVYVEEKDISKVLCVNFQKATELPGASSGTSATDATSSQAVAAVTDLQSYPGGNGCVLLDFDGQYVSGTPWNRGNPIDAAPANLTDAEKQAVWELVSEDYRPFHLNVTTSEAVFNTYPKNRRMRCIFTPTNTAAPGAGGVAYLGSFSWNDETPCWVFNGGIKGAGEAGSHEVGHTFGLSHDGRTSPAEEYYAGQGNWAPIMGVGYYESVVHWSKGEYANANNTEDDLAMITGSKYGVGYRADDYGNTIAAAGSLTVSATGAVSSTGVIERTGDIDMFSFTTGGGTVTLNLNPAARYANLDILATLYNSSGSVVATSNLAALNATLSASLAAGTYYVSVTGTGSGSPATTGYSNYGSLSYYAITGTIPGGTSTAIVTLYQDCNYGGTFAVGLGAGNYTIADLAAKGVSNKGISSIRVSAGYEVVLYKNDNFTGSATTISADASCLGSIGWNDSASSVRIRSTSNQLPVVNISSPASGSSYTTPANVAINVNASDNDGAVSKVEFYNGTTKLGEDLTVPYSFAWSSIVAGSYTIRAVATDDRGGQATAQVTITVGTGTGAVVYKHCNYGGYAVNLPLGTYNRNQLLQKGVLNDDISSLRVNSGYEMILYRDDNFRGSAYLFRGNASCLVSIPLSNGSTVNLNDWTSSIVVRQSTAQTVARTDEATPLQGMNILSYSVFPNPAGNQVVIRYGEPGNYFDVQVVDVNGATVLTASRMQSGQPLNIAGLKTGIYFIKLNTGQEVITRKLIKH